MIKKLTENGTTIFFLHNKKANSFLIIYPMPSMVLLTDFFSLLPSPGVSLLMQPGLNVCVRLLETRALKPSLLLHIYPRRKQLNFSHSFLKLIFEQKRRSKHEQSERSNQPLPSPPSSSFKISLTVCSTSLSFNPLESLCFLLTLHKRAGDERLIDVTLVFEVFKALTHSQSSPSFSSLNW